MDKIAPETRSTPEMQETMGDLQNEREATEMPMARSTMVKGTMEEE